MLVDTALQDNYVNNTDGYTSFVKGVNLAYDWFNLTAIMVFIMTVWVSILCFLATSTYLFFGVIDLSLLVNW